MLCERFSLAVTGTLLIKLRTINRANKVRPTCYIAPKTFEACCTMAVTPKCYKKKHLLNWKPLNHIKEMCGMT